MRRLFDSRASQKVMRAARSVILLCSLFALLLPVSGIALAQKEVPFPEVLPLPDGHQPEGIVIGRGSTYYVGSLANGSIFQGNLRGGEGKILVPPQDGRVAVGLSYDKRTHLIYAAGGGGGAGYVYSAATGEGVAAFQFTADPSFVNDVVVTRRAAYFTDSFQPNLYKVPLSPNGALPDPNEVQTITLGGEFNFISGAFNANGIDATPDGRWLIIVNSAEGALYRVDPNTGEAVRIDLGGGSVLNGDGILLHGRTLYVVQNSLNQISVVRLNSSLTSGEIVNVLTDPDFRVPTTIDKFGNALYAVNARFGATPTPETEYEVVRVPIK